MKKTIKSLFLSSLLSISFTQSKAEISPELHTLSTSLLTLGTLIGTWYCNYRSDTCEKILQQLQIIEKYEHTPALEELIKNEKYKIFKKQITQDKKLFHTLTWIFGPLAIASFASTNWGLYRLSKHELPKSSDNEKFTQQFMSPKIQTISSFLIALGLGTGASYCFYRANTYKKLLNVLQVQEKYNLPNVEQQKLSKEKMTQYKKLFYIAAYVLSTGTFAGICSSYWGAYRWKNKMEKDQFIKQNIEPEDAELIDLEKSLISLQKLIQPTTSTYLYNFYAKINPQDSLSIRKTDLNKSLKEEFISIFGKKSLTDIVIQSFTDVSSISLDALVPEEKILLEKSVNTIKLYLFGDDAKDIAKQTSSQKKYNRAFTKNPNALYLACLSIHELKNEHSSNSN